MKKRPRISLMMVRRGAQAGMLALVLLIIWKTRYPLEGFINPAVVFQLDPLVMLATALAERVWLPGLWITLLVLVATAVFGRVFCGWFCPLGALMDGVAALRARVRRYAEGVPGSAKNTKYAVLGCAALLAVFGIQAVWFFDPLAIVVRAVSFTIHPAVNASISGIFEKVLTALNYPAGLEAVYYTLKQNILDLSAVHFPHARLAALVFAGILAAVVIQRRFWCRYLCPLGALLALVARLAPFRRLTGPCRSGCSVCMQVCRMNAILPDASYHREECVLCMDCVAACPVRTARFTFPPRHHKTTPAPSPGNGISRGQFLAWMGGLLAFLPARVRAQTAATPSAKSTVLRPPAALPEQEFVQRCVRCGNCMKVCLTNVLQPAVWESGWQGVWTPRLDLKIGYCEYNCTLCGAVCPTGAIRPLTVAEKQRTRIGVAVVDRARCLPWATGEECLVCEEHCPVADKAIKKLPRKTPRGATVECPVVDASLCVGCGVCSYKCPAGPGKAITVIPLQPAAGKRV